MPDQTALQTTLKPPTPKVVISAQTLFDEVKAFFYWWYVEMPTWYLKLVRRIAIICDDTFSISLLVKSFFVPWRRDYNWVGYFFGIAIRLVYLPITISISAVILVILLAITAIWALLPIVATYYLIKAPLG